MKFRVSVGTVQGRVMPVDKAAENTRGPKAKGLLCLKVTGVTEAF